MLRGKCKRLVFFNVGDLDQLDLSGFMDLEIENMFIGGVDRGLLRILRRYRRRM